MDCMTHEWKETRVYLCSKVQQTSILTVKYLIQKAALPQKASCCKFNCRLLTICSLSGVQHVLFISPVPLMLTSVHFPCEVIQKDLQTLLFSHKDSALGSWLLHEANPQCFPNQGSLQCSLSDLYQCWHSWLPQLRPHQVLYKQKKQDSLSDKKVVERRSDAQRCSEIKCLADGHPSPGLWITPKLVFHSVIEAANLLLQSIKTLVKMQ